MNESLKRDLAAYAHSLGFERAGVTSAAALLPDEAYLRHWIAEGRAGEMGYLEREPERRARPAELLAGAKSVIMLARSYAQPSTPLQGEGGRRPDEGSIARYAWGRDYHKVMTKRLESLVRYLQSMAPGSECRTFVDTGPLLERALARRAGLGFIGKNTMLITKGLGSWVFLASVITTLELPADAPDERSCGECRLCIDACPTEAITAPFELDARRCIAYLTIEKDGSLDKELRGKMEGWIFGCDVCQDVCPHNVRTKPSPYPLPEGRGPIAFEEESTFSLQGEGGRRPDEGFPMLAEILSLNTDEEFRLHFEGTSLMRAGRESLIRNACVAAANLSRTDLTARIQDLANHDTSPTVREHAAWALGKLCAGHLSAVPPASIPDPRS